MSTQRKSTRLAQKAAINAGKDTIQIAQDLLVKKLGDLSGEEIEQEGKDLETDFDFYAQHFERPVKQITMEAIKILTEEGTKKQTKAGGTKKMTAKVGTEA